MNKVFTTGDCHRQFEKIQHFCEVEQTTRDDILICLGDFGVNYYLDERDIYVKEQVSQLPITLIIIHGNHEERAWNISGYKKKDYNVPNGIQGTFYVEDKYPNILFCEDIAQFMIKNKTFLALSGAYSIDKHFRLAYGYGWFSSEQIPSETRQNFIQYLNTVINNDNKKHKVDYVLSHTCPTQYMPRDLFLPNIDQSTVDHTTEDFLRDVENLLDYNHWYCGHFHSNRTIWDKGTMLFEKIIPLDI